MCAFFKYKVKHHPIYQKILRSLQCIAMVPHNLQEFTMILRDIFMISYHFFYILPFVRNYAHVNKKYFLNISKECEANVLDFLENMSSVLHT